jgi:hypothetical protein
MRASGVRGLLIYCSDFRCSHWTAISGNRWPDDVRLSELENAFSRCQRPKNSHSRMITGIGTPNSQSRTPRPMFASLNSSDGFKNAKRYVRFQQPGGKSTPPCHAARRRSGEGAFSGRRSQSHFADPDAAARKLVQIANASEAVQDGRIYIELINGHFLKEGGTPDQYRAALARAVTLG